ncbi:hypothetical protein BCR34DRAFT_654965 [Clohesyomyces aquaticus]|uniref:Uncharacterized protein n=1 Tax=Clohesyomyces aquaticus TaxID=1231657 RepID=A0A1Y1ZJP8_9PLEO|nr:hypothetical protein BCR34DRAFT_654965 [Clohesyomyces aquaticus]
MSLEPSQSTLRPLSISPDHTAFPQRRCVRGMDSLAFPHRQSNELTVFLQRRCVRVTDPLEFSITDGLNWPLIASGFDFRRSNQTAVWSLALERSANEEKQYVVNRIGEHPRYVRTTFQEVGSYTALGYEVLDGFSFIPVMEWTDPPARPTGTAQQTQMDELDRADDERARPMRAGQLPRSLSLDVKEPSEKPDDNSKKHHGDNNKRDGKDGDGGASAAGAGSSGTVVTA